MSNDIRQMDKFKIGRGCFDFVLKYEFLELEIGIALDNILNELTECLEASKG